MFELRALSFEKAFENITPSGLGCIWEMFGSLRFLMICPFFGREFSRFIQIFSPQHVSTWFDAPAFRVHFWVFVQHRQHGHGFIRDEVKLTQLVRAREC